MAYIWGKTEDCTNANTTGNCTLLVTDTSDHSREDSSSLTAHSRSPSPEEQQQQLVDKFQHLHTSSQVIHTTGSNNLQRNGAPETDTNSKGNCCC